MGNPGSPAKYLAIYEIDSDNVAEAVGELRKRAGEMQVIDCLEVAMVAPFTFIGP